MFFSHKIIYNFERDTACISFKIVNNWMRYIGYSIK